MNHILFNHTEAIYSLKPAFTSLIWVLMMAYVLLWAAGALALDSRTANNTNTCGNSQGNSGTVLHVSNQSQQAIFWSSTAIAVFVSLVQGAITTLIDLCEAESLWTVRFRLAVFEHYWWIAISAALLASFVSMIISFLAGNSNDALSVLALATASSLVVFRYAWPAWRNRHFCENRWAAWTGPSRTGIAPELVGKIGIPRNGGIQSPLIDADPTELLKVSLDSPSPPATTTEKGRLNYFNPFLRRRNDLEAGLSLSPLADSHSTLNDPNNLNTTAANGTNPPSGSPAPRSLPPGVFPPVTPGKSVSLLWGEFLGFSRRVSRGVLSIPSRLLVSQPVTDAGHNGQAMCLMHGVFGRNKGLAPWTFILKLSVQKFEENSVQWPRPAKVLRGYYEKEIEVSYGGLGEAFVKAATEMALLFADSRPRLVKDWFEQVMEQQDLSLARQAYQFGATDKELSLLYRLSYAAMLVSLACHTYGRKKRPEITVFKTYYALNLETLGPLPAWVSTAEIQMRVAEEEVNVASKTLEGLVRAVLPKPPPPPPPVDDYGQV
ncbi:hypothetical protein BS47DRAFT_1490477 [Hydnum rufescens UP504]|uniref:Transmembrane protein n=1 Tax=Hydnum rufescens UP504 TaxID=1448309 RepID=A0A9P6DET0_9AGAM|nr:hypothetical protein BS47DRAFT_1490477 [Hydnum rufescens UP504]